MAVEACQKSNNETLIAAFNTTILNDIPEDSMNKATGLPIGVTLGNCSLEVELGRVRTKLNNMHPIFFISRSCIYLVCARYWIGFHFVHRGC